MSIKHKRLWGNITLLHLFYWLKKCLILPCEYFYSFFYYLSFKPARCCDISLSIKTLGKKRTALPHPIGIVIGKGVKIGTNCRIYQNVTIGSKSIFDIKYPSIGNNVVICANALILGNIQIGDNVIIGAGAVVKHNIIDNVIVAGNPAKVIKQNIDLHPRKFAVK